MRWLLRFGYDGSAFAGWARQPGLRTVEGEIQAGLARAGIISAGPTRGLDVASRTDRGVSARANGLLLESPLPGPAVLRLLNGISPEINFSGATRVGDDFRVRHAVRRVYRYYEPHPIGGTARWVRASRPLVGEIDVRSFGRRIPGSKPCWRTVEAISLEPVGTGVVVEIRARSFVWGMVRKTIGALREYASGRLSIAQLEAAARGEARLNLPLAEPDRLILWEVEYPVTWEFRWKGPNRHQETWARAARESAWARSEVVRSLTGSEDGADW